MQVLYLCAGPDQAYVDSGFPYPKNLTEIHGQPIIERVVRSQPDLTRHAKRIVFAIRRSEDERFHTGDVARLLLPEARVCLVEDGLHGAACSALLTVEELEPEEPLLIVNGDQLILEDLWPHVEKFRKLKLDGGIIVFEAVHPRWSYVKCDSEGFVIEAAEKRPISKMATAGVYYFSRARAAMDAIVSMIKKDASVDGRFYVCPAYNEMILQQARIGVSQIPAHSYVSFASPQGMHDFANQIASRGADK
jgi:dTDP-glucose pyrophosphorylase